MQTTAHATKLPAADTTKDSADSQLPASTRFLSALRGLLNRISCGRFPANTCGELAAVIAKDNLKSSALDRDSSGEQHDLNLGRNDKAVLQPKRSPLLAIGEIHPFENATVKSIAKLVEIKTFLLEEIEDIKKGALAALKNLSSKPVADIDTRLARDELAAFIKSNSDNRVAEIYENSEHANSLVEFSQSLRIGFKAHAAELKDISDILEHRVQLGIISKDDPRLEILQNLEADHAFLSESLSARHLASLITKDGKFTESDVAQFKSGLSTDLEQFRLSLKQLQLEFYELDSSKADQRIKQFTDLVAEIKKDATPTKENYDKLKAAWNEASIPSDVNAYLAIKVDGRLTNATARLDLLLAEVKPENMTASYLKDLIHAADKPHNDNRRAKQSLAKATAALDQIEAAEFNSQIENLVTKSNTTKQDFEAMLKASSLSEKNKLALDSFFKEEFNSLESAILKKHGYKGYGDLNPRAEFRVLEELHGEANLPALACRLTNLVKSAESLSKLDPELTLVFVNSPKNNFNNYAEQAYNVEIAGPLFMTVKEFGACQPALEAAESSLKLFTPNLVNKIIINLEPQPSDAPNAFLTLKIGTKGDSNG